MSVEDTFFDELVKAIEKVRVPCASGIYDRGWNAGVRACLVKIHHFFGRGKPPEEAIQPETEEQDDPVNHPSHYTSGKIEVIDFIEDQKLEYHLGSAMKYICRAGKKNPDKTIEDLQKAVWYIKRYIEVLGG